MNINSFNFKLLSIVVGAFLIMTALVTILADTQIKNILDKNQEAIYVDRVETIIGILGRSNKNLQKTGLVEVYADDFRKTALLTLRDNYYDRGVESVYPFILHKDGKVVMHPNLVKGDDSLQDKELYKKIIAQKNKSGTSIAQSFEVQGAWYVVSEFDEWDWIVGYTVPLDLKYLEARIFRNTFITFMVGITLSMVIIIIYIVTRFTRPIIYLTEASKQIADGTLDQTINLTGKDEIGILATSFNNMRLAIKSKIAELNHEIKER